MAAKNHILARKQRKEEEKAGVAKPLSPLALSPANKVLLFWAAMHLLCSLERHPTPQMTKHLVLSQCFTDFHPDSLS